MRLEKVVREVRRWSSKFDPESNIQTRKSADGEVVVSFVVRTTKSRASSIKTRLDLTLREVIPEEKFCSHPTLVGPPPEDRGSLSFWQINVRVFPSRRLAS
jgi:hypothetical protein